MKLQCHTGFLKKGGGATFNPLLAMAYLYINER